MCKYPYSDYVPCFTSVYMVKESTGQLKTSLSLKSCLALLEVSPDFAGCFKKYSQPTHY